MFGSVKAANANPEDWVFAGERVRGNMPRYSALVNAKEAPNKALESGVALKSDGSSRKSPIIRPKCAQILPFAAVRCASEGHFRSPNTLRPQKGQPLAVLVEIHQCEGRQQPLMVVLDAAIAHLGVLEDPLENAEGPLHLGAHAGVVAILALLFLIHHAMDFFDTTMGYRPASPRTACWL